MGTCGREAVSACGMKPVCSDMWGLTAGQHKDGQQLALGRGMLHSLNQMGGQ